MRVALEQLSAVSIEDAVHVRRDAAIVQAAAKQAEARDIEQAAAELRLHAERRIGELAEHQENVEGFTATVLHDFRRLALIPRSYVTRNVGLADHEDVIAAMDDFLAEGHSRRKTYTVDLFAVSVRHQLDGRSCTTRAVILASLELGREETKYPWLWKSWDGSWLFEFRDARTKRFTKGSSRGSMQDALEARGRLAEKISPRTTELLPIRNRKPTLSALLDNVRQARLQLAEISLSTEQKKSLDGAYGRLDDLATQIVEAINVG